MRADTVWCSNSRSWCVQPRSTGSSSHQTSPTAVSPTPQWFNLAGACGRARNGYRPRHTTLYTTRVGQQPRQQARQHVRMAQSQLRGYADWGGAVLWDASLRVTHPVDIGSPRTEWVPATLLAHDIPPQKCQQHRAVQPEHCMQATPQWATGIQHTDSMAVSVQQYATMLGGPYPPPPSYSLTPLVSIAIDFILHRRPTTPTA